MAKKVARKKPVAKAAAKKTAKIDYKKEYEKLKKAAKRVMDEEGRGQIESGCDDGEEALEELADALGLQSRYRGGQFEVLLSNDLPCRMKDDSNIELVISIDGKKLEPRHIHNINVVDESERD